MIKKRNVNKQEQKDEEYYYIKVHKDRLNVIICIVAFYVFFKLYFGVCDILDFDSFPFLFIFIFAAPPMTALFHKLIRSFLEK